MKILFLWSNSSKQNQDTIPSKKPRSYYTKKQPVLLKLMNYSKQIPFFPLRNLHWQQMTSFAVILFFFFLIGEQFSPCNYVSAGGTNNGGSQSSMFRFLEEENNWYTFFYLGLYRRYYLDTHWCTISPPGEINFARNITAPPAFSLLFPCSTSLCNAWYLTYCNYELNLTFYFSFFPLHTNVEFSVQKPDSAREREISRM